MRNILLLFATLLLIASCKDGVSSNQKILLDSSGNMNHISVVIENDMWNGRLGEAVRNVLTSPIYGLPQDEPTFSLNHIPPAVFDGYVTRNRSILKIETGKDPAIKIARNVYAKPQKVVVISGNNEDEIIHAINSSSEKIIEAFKEEELKEMLRRINVSKHRLTSIKEKLGLDIDFQSVYSIAKEEEGFIWLRKDITTGHSHLMIYELPYEAIIKNDSTVSQVIKIRDSIGQEYFKGRLDGIVDANGDTISSYMVTEDAYTPFHGETLINDKTTLETKGLWELTNDFMGGPFINYTIEDKANNRWVIVEGFVFAPSVEKRNYMFELEAILKSAKIE